MADQKSQFNISEDKVWYARAKFGKEETDAVVKCMNEFRLAPGKYTYDFEKKVAKLYDKEYGVMVNSGSSALLLAAELLDIKPGDEIITAGTGFPTTINPFLLKGAKIVLVDVAIPDLNLYFTQLEESITSRTKAIIVAPIWGTPHDMGYLRIIADRYNVKLIEDSCDSIGQTLDGKPTGSWSDISMTSFYPSHVITAAGGGGMICVKTKEEETKLRVFRDWGRTGTDSEDLDDRFDVYLGNIPYDAKFFYGEQGYNLKAVEIQAAFGLVQLKKLKEWNKKRLDNYNKLLKITRNFNIQAVESRVSKSKPSWLAFPFFSKDRMKLARHLETNGIQTRPILAGNFTLHPAFKDANIRVPYKLENCNYITEFGIGVGLHQEIGDKELSHIENTFKEYYG